MFKSAFHISALLPISSWARIRRCASPETYFGNATTNDSYQLEYRDKAQPDVNLDPLLVAIVGKEVAAIALLNAGVRDNRP